MKTGISQLSALDLLCRRLAVARDHLVLPLAQVAHVIVRDSSWQALGYARASDFTREKLGRSARWLRDLAALHTVLRELPSLALALCGRDGRKPLGRVAALLIGRIATPKSVDAWIAFARSNTVRALRSEARRAREQRSPWPSAQHEILPDASGQEDDAEEPWTLVTLALPGAVRAAFQETLDLHRAVVGRESSTAEFVDSLSAETSGDVPPSDDVQSHRLARGAPVHQIEEELAHATNLWAHLYQPAGIASAGSADLGLGEANEAIKAVLRFAQLSSSAGSGDAATLFEQLAAIVELENEVEIQIGRLLASLGDRHGWRELRFASVGHYATERLRMSRTSAEDRAGLSRALRDRPGLRRAYETGRLGMEAALLVRRMVSRSPTSSSLEAAWVERASAVTIKRLRDEVRIASRSQVVPACSPNLGPGTASFDPAEVSQTSSDAKKRRTGLMQSLTTGHRSYPCDDRDWQDSLQRAPGDGLRRICFFGALALRALVPDVFLRIRLPPEIARSFVETLECKRRQLARDADHDVWEANWKDPPWECDLTASSGNALESSHSDEKPTAHGSMLPSWLAARVYADRVRRVPTWVALLAMLEEYARTWDVRSVASRRASAAVYIRAGWRCTAPGCTSRKNLEDHHIQYRSRGGGNELANRTCVCRFHHQRGEHGGLAACRGKAPLEIVWRLGRGELAHWYRNERFVSPVPSENAWRLARHRTHAMTR